MGAAGPHGPAADPFNQRPETIVIDETTGRGHMQDTFRHVFSETRAAVIAGIVDEEATAAAGPQGTNDPEPTPRSTS